MRSRWVDVQPGAAERHAFLKRHSWEEFSSWHLAVAEGPVRRRRPATPSSSDFTRLHRTGLIACYYRAAEWEHTEVMVAAHELLLHFDRTRA